MTAPKTILLVEDDEISCVITSRLLSREYQVLIAHNGHDGLYTYQHCAPDLVLMDINLGDPNMDGVRTMQEIRTGNPNALIFALTALDSNREKEALDVAGFDGVLTKPYEVSELRDTLRSHLSKKGR